MRIGKEIREIKRDRNAIAKQIEDRRTSFQRWVDRQQRRSKKLLRKLKPLRRRQALIATVREHLGEHAETVIVEAHGAGLELALACALVEQESLGRNVFGCDLGSRSTAPWCHQAVTEAKVRELIAYVNRGGPSNGVGLTQLTSIGFILDAMESGGAWKPSAQCEVGFDLLKSLIGQVGEFKGIGAYNGGLGNPIPAYASEVIERRAVWRKRLA